MMTCDISLPNIFDLAFITLKLFSFFPLDSHLSYVFVVETPEAFIIVVILQKDLKPVLYISGLQRNAVWECKIRCLIETDWILLLTDRFWEHYRDPDILSTDPTNRIHRCEYDLPEWNSDIRIVFPANDVHFKRNQYFKVIKKRKMLTVV